MSLLDALLDSWMRSNTILVNLIQLVPEGGLSARATADGPTVGTMVAHMHYVRLVFVEEDAPEYAVEVPRNEWASDAGPAELAAMLNQSALVVRDAVAGRLASGRGMDRHYDHSILFLQHMIWHEGYHHGQIKLALKIAGMPIDDEAASPGTWGIWMRKSKA